MLSRSLMLRIRTAGTDGKRLRRGGGEIDEIPWYVDLNLIFRPAQ